MPSKQKTFYFSVIYLSSGGDVDVEYRAETGTQLEFDNGDLSVKVCNTCVELGYDVLAVADEYSPITEHFKYADPELKTQAKTQVKTWAEIQGKNADETHA